MAHLCPDKLLYLFKTTPDHSLETPAGVLELYCGKEADTLINKGYLNMVLRDKTGSLNVIPLRPRDDANQEGQEQIPADVAVGFIKLTDDELRVGHWNGAVSRFNPVTLEFLGTYFGK